MKVGGNSVRHESGFTMVEIALCLAVIGFALVAIIGVLPLGMQVQRDSREETIVNNDGAILLEAIRHGKPIEDLPIYIEEIRRVDWNNVTNIAPAVTISNAVGFLSDPTTLRNEAIVRSMNGPAADTGPDAQELSFRYKVLTEIRPFHSLDPVTWTNEVLRLAHSNHMHEVRMTIRYPLLPGNRHGTGKKVFRAVVSGMLEPMTNTNPDEVVWFFRPQRFAGVP